MTLEQKTQITAQILELACRIYAPKDTGNLSINGIKSVYSDGLWQVVIGGEVAPYAIDTNEEWTDGRYGGRINPNQGWVERAIESVRPSIIGIFQDLYTVEEIENYLMKLGTNSIVATTTRRKGVIDFDI